MSGDTTQHQNGHLERRWTVEQETLDASLVRLRTSAGEVVGTGFLVGILLRKILMSIKRINNE